MSTGMVICPACRREVHQWGPKEIRKGWIHCEDSTAICEDAHAAYPKSSSDVRGAYCGADGPLPS